MSIYVRVEKTPVVVIGRSVGTNPTITVLFPDDSRPLRTDLSRLVADGGITEIETILASLPCPWCRETGQAYCCVDDVATKAKANGRKRREERS